jgi:hypothetical protein
LLIVVLSSAASFFVMFIRKRLRCRSQTAAIDASQLQHQLVQLQQQLAPQAQQQLAPQAFYLK